MTKLKQLREESFLTQAELAEKIGSTEHTISNWERGKQKPTFKYIRKLAKVLKVNPKDIEF
jgi:DNA-binding XRE family transcriptional regulator